MLICDEPIKGHPDDRNVAPVLRIRFLCGRYAFSTRTPPTKRGGRWGLRTDRTGYSQLKVSLLPSQVQKLKIRRGSSAGIVAKRSDLSRP